jgi:hypothetical protein
LDRQEIQFKGGKNKDFQTGLTCFSKRQDPNGINVQILHFKWERIVLE